LDGFNKKVQNHKINEINSNDVKFFDETLKLIFSLKKEASNGNEKTSNIIINNNSHFQNTDSLLESKINRNLNFESPYKRSISLINNSSIQGFVNSNSFDRKLSLGSNEVNLTSQNLDNENKKLTNCNNNFNNHNQEFKTNNLKSNEFNIFNNVTQVLDDLKENIIVEFDTLKKKTSGSIINCSKKFLWDETNLAENTFINKELDLFTVNISNIHYAAKSKQEFFSGSFS